MVNLTVLFLSFCDEDFVGALMELGNSMLLGHSSFVCQLLLNFSDEETGYFSGEFASLLFLDEGGFFIPSHFGGHMRFVFGRIVSGTQVQFESCDGVSPERCCGHSHPEMIAPEAGFTFPATCLER